MYRWRFSGNLPHEYETKRFDKCLPGLIRETPNLWMPNEQAPIEFVPSRTQLAKLFTQGCIELNGRTASAKEILHSPCDITIFFKPEHKHSSPPSTAEHSRDYIKTVYEDDDLLVIDKPQGMTVHRSPTQSSGTLVDWLEAHQFVLAPQGAPDRPGIVHRIDKDTSGLLVIAKTAWAHEKLVELFQAHSLTRRYWAIAHGHMRQQQMTVRNLLGRNPKNRLKISALAEGGKIAITRFRKIATATPRPKTPLSWIEAELETGRTHQVRVHLSDSKLPIIGDPTYGRSSDRSKLLGAQDAAKPSIEIDHSRPLLDQLSYFPGQLLHARHLAFIHPRTQKPLILEAPLPPIWQKLFDEIGWNVNES